jgi:ABC-type transport system involved in multi-copper enzyme maturation permease subunit
MNTRVLIKEGRPLFWPWCADMFTGAVSLIRPLHSIEWVGLLGIVLGIPLLATLPFGNEFQNRTLSLLLSQPVGRARIWFEKSSIAFVAVASVAAVFAFSPLFVETLPDRGQQAHALALIFAVLASATFWTLIARSTIGGIALSVGTVLLLAGFSTLATGIGANSLFLMTHYTSISVAIPLCYAGVMLWLGARTLARYQVTGTMAGDDLLTTGSNALLGAFSHRARSNPTRPVWNLIHKEFRLLRPVWLVTVLTASTWTCFAFVDLSHQQKPLKSLPLPIMAFALSSGFIIAVLAGCLSLGEEKTSGTYAWHRTLPISAARQWSIKICVALFVSFICAGLIPVLLLIAGEHLFPAVFPSEDATFLLTWLLAVLFLTLFAFWCACAVNGTVTAVVWVIPILAVVSVTPEMVNWAGFRLADLLAFKSNIFANFRFTVLLSSLMSGPDINRMVMPRGNTSDPLIFWVPSLVLAVIQSYRMFRAPIRESVLSVVRKLLPLVVVGLACSLFACLAEQLSDYARNEILGASHSVDDAIQNVLSVDANRATTQPLQLTFDELNKYSAPRLHVSVWLRGATFSIAPDKDYPTTCCESASKVVFRRWNYNATAHLPSGAVMTFSIEPRAEVPGGQPKWKASIRWPGETTDETLLDR